MELAASCILVQAARVPVAAHRYRYACYLGTEQQREELACSTRPMHALLVEDRTLVRGFLQEVKIRDWSVPSLGAVIYGVPKPLTLPTFPAIRACRGPRKKKNEG
ncbi:hypothetical protein B0T19DRAFT_399153 [Cercophora scortea]|uniref:Uncharacterized protein n=1 Tax=Cercophora scortea TaxID=314031 RepID=A0AAE0MIH7_9PEZI|nr:hypothetical protein B0T19DRAFT_399153 [Cercophora scortea]